MSVLLWVLTLPWGGSGLDGAGGMTQRRPPLGAAGDIAGPGWHQTFLNGQTGQAHQLCQLGGQAPVYASQVGGRQGRSHPLRIGPQGPERLGDLSKATQHCEWQGCSWHPGLPTEHPLCGRPHPTSQEGKGLSP